MALLDRLRSFISNRGKKPEDAIGTSEPAVNLKQSLPEPSAVETAPERDPLAGQGTVVSGGTVEPQALELDPEVITSANIALEQPELTEPQGVRQITIEDQFGNFDGVRFDVPQPDGSTETFTLTADEYKSFVEGGKAGFETITGTTREEAELLRGARSQFQLDFAERQQQLKDQDVLDKFINQFPGLREELNYKGGALTYDQARQLIDAEFPDGITTSGTVKALGKAGGLFALFSATGNAASNAHPVLKVAAVAFFADDLLNSQAKNKKEVVSLADKWRATAEKDFSKIREGANAGGDPVDMVRAFNKEVELLYAAEVLIKQQMVGKSATEQAEAISELSEIEAMLRPNGYVSIERQLLFNSIQNPAPTKPQVGGTDVAPLSVEQERLIRESGISQ